jgi:hypothetical protein
MDLENTETTDKLETLIIPFLTKGKEELLAKGNKFVHYTSAENAMSIINTKKIWMRSPKCMNDYMEISHGHNKLLTFFNTQEYRDKFINAVDLYEDGLALEILNQFDEWWKNINLDTFVTSVSVHRKEEDLHGRLSMWRAYGDKPAKAALVLNNPTKPIKGLNIILCPALYYNDQNIDQELLNIIDNITSNIEFLKALKKETIKGTIIMSLTMLAICLKHEGFKEEQEWRLIHLPKVAQPNSLITNTIECINGIPQVVYKLPLENSPENEVHSVSIKELIDKVIIGPTDYPLPLLDAFSITLENAGIEKPFDKIIISGIPLRT